MKVIFAILCYLCILLRHSIAYQDGCTSCRCEKKQSSVCGLEFRLTWLERNMEAVDGKIAEWVKQQYKIRDLESESNMQKQEIIQLKQNCKNLESNKISDTPKFEALRMQLNNIENDVAISDAPKSDIEISRIFQNLTSLTRKMDEVESKIAKNLTLEVNELKEQMHLEKEFSYSLQEKLNEAMERVQQLDKSNGEWENIQNRLTRLENSITDQERHHVGLIELEQKLASLKSAIETVLYFKDTWNLSLNVFNETLLLNQKTAENLEKDLLRVKGGLTLLQGEIQNLNKSTVHDFEPENFEVTPFSPNKTKTSAEHLGSLKGISDTDLQDLFNHAEKQLTEKFSEYAEAADERFDIVLSNERKRIEKLDSDLKHLQKSLEMKETKFIKELSSTMEYLKDIEERQKETMERMEDYLMSTLNSWQKEIAVPRSLDADTSNEENDNVIVNNSNNDVKQEYNEDGETDKLSCFLPSHLDIQLLVAQDLLGKLLPINTEQIREVQNGSKLRFGCKSFGNSVLIDPESEEQILRNFTLECMNSQWKGGNFPQCKMLMDESEIRALATKLHIQNVKGRTLCLNRGGYLPDTNDCAGYFLCVNGTMVPLKCNSPLMFNAAIGICDYPSNVECRARGYFSRTGINTFNENESDSVYHHEENNEDVDIKVLSSLIPTVTLEPNRLNRAYSMMATGTIGELVVYPRTSLTLNCLFPIAISTTSTYPTWIINSSYHGRFRKSWPMKTAHHKSSLNLVSVTTEDSGIYSCVGPNGKRNDVQLMVQAVECPTLYSAPGNELQIVHRSLPDIGANILSSQVFFHCPAGYKNPGPSRAVCTVDGSWSNSIPLCEPYTEYIQEANHGRRNGCLPWDWSANQHLIIEPSPTNRPFYYVGDTLTFTCKDRQAMMTGPRRIVCMNNGQWSAPLLPGCVAWT